MVRAAARSIGLRTARVVGVVASLAFVAAASAGGCGGVKYPACENDEQCNDDGHKGVCFNLKCVECRDDDGTSATTSRGAPHQSGCATGQSCQMGACTEIPGYCDDTHACPAGSTCGAGNRCQEQKTTANAPFVECDDTKPCGTGAHCANGHCIAPPSGGPGCTDFPSPKFDYESPDLRGEARQTLERLATCITKGTLKGSQVLLTGHCDNRGEQEFNMSLGDNRAEAVKTFLVGLGVSGGDIRTSSRGELDATGTDEASWATDRRVDIEVR
jgi:outer membrane protein OmpA-like peptidoglycan-associated protein